MAGTVSHSINNNNNEWHKWQKVVGWWVVGREMFGGINRVGAGMGLCNKKECVGHPAVPVT